MVLDMMIRTPLPTSIKGEKNGQEYTVATDVAPVNAWSHGKIKKIKVVDFFFNFRDIVWKDKVLEVEYDLFTGLIKQWITEGMSKEQAIDLFFEMSEFGENPPKPLTKQAVA